MNLACGSTCMEPMTLNCDISATQCGHVFHTNCITKWIETGKKTCPQCRKNCTMSNIIKLYVSADEDVKEEDNQGMSCEGACACVFTPLQWAAEKGHVEVCRLIILDKIKQMRSDQYLENEELFEHEQYLERLECNGPRRNSIPQHQAQRGSRKQRRQGRGRARNIYAKFL